MGPRVSVADAVAYWPDVMAAYEADRVVVPHAAMEAYRQAAAGVLDPALIDGGDVERVEFMQGPDVVGAQVAVGVLTEESG